MPSSNRWVTINDAKIVLRADGHELPVCIVGARVGAANAATDRRLGIKIHRDAYADIVSRRLFGLTPSVLPDAPRPDPSGNVVIELRVATEPPEPIGATGAQLEQWVASLAQCPSGADQLDAGAWLVSGVGGPAVDSPITPTLWNYLPDLSVDLDAVTNDVPESVMGDGIDAVVSYLADAAPDAASALGFDLAGHMLKDLLDSSVIDGEFDAARAIEIVRRKIITPQSMATSDLLSLANAVLIEEGAVPTIAGSGAALVYPVDGDNGSWHGVIEEREHDVVIVYSLVPVDLSADRVIELLELTVRLNRDLDISNFDLDLDGGDFALRTGIDLRTSSNPAESIRHAIHANAETLDDHLPAIKAFIAGASVAESLALLTSSRHSPSTA